ncbi:hypothetical protein VDGL01_02253 [Verticillium dahliae]
MFPISIHPPVYHIYVSFLGQTPAPEPRIDDGHETTLHHFLPLSNAAFTDSLNSLQRTSPPPRGTQHTHVQTRTVAPCADLPPRDDNVADANPGTFPFSPRLASELLPRDAPDDSKRHPASSASVLPPDVRINFERRLPSIHDYILDDNPIVRHHLHYLSRYPQYPQNLRHPYPAASDGAIRSFFLQLPTHVTLEPPGLGFRPSRPPHSQSLQRLDAAPLDPPICATSRPALSS